MIDDLSKIPKIPAAFLSLICMYFLVTLLANANMDNFMFKQDVRHALEHRSARHRKHAAAFHQAPIDDDFLDDQKVKDVLNADKNKDDINQLDYADLPDFQPDSMVFGDSLNDKQDGNGNQVRSKKGAQMPEDWNKRFEIEKEAILHNKKIKQQALFKDGFVRNKLGDDDDEEDKKKEEEKEDVVVEIAKNQTFGIFPFPHYVEDEKEGGPGYMGRPHEIDLKRLSKEDKERKTKEFEINFFDEWTNRMISVHRSLPDGRTLRCQKNKYPNRMPPVSVLIIFHNEAWSTLLRSVHSVIRRTAPQLLKEIVLLDDFSDQAHLKKPLEAYFQVYIKVRILRAKKRLGLIAGRNELVRRSTGKILVFLDSHVECFTGWLEPLIAPIVANNRTVVYPTIEMINPNTFGLKASERVSTVGGFDMDKLNFVWMYTRKIDFSKPQTYVKSPTMPGGLYAISRSWFIKLGMYDEGMSIWGSENLEISFKVWMCGGQLVQSACSHVGHVFRRRNPNLFGSHIGYKNHIRLAEVWMDEYKHLYYEELAYELGDFGDVSKRLALRKQLKCQPFSWYLFRVAPEIYKKVQRYGEYSGMVKNVELAACLDSTRTQGFIRMNRCDIRNKHQHWRLTADGEVRSGDYVLALMPATEKTREMFKLVKAGTGAAKTKFRYDEFQHLLHEHTGKCLQADRRQLVARLGECNNSKFQVWKLTSRKDYQAMIKEKKPELSISWGEQEKALGQD